MYDSISPVDYRYWIPEVAHYLSENGFTRYKLDVEVALIRTLYIYGICDRKVVREAEAASKLVTTEAVYAEENITRHDIKALVNCMRSHMSKETARWVHFMATSYDIIDTANAARYRDVAMHVLLPTLRKLEKVLIDLAIRESNQLQVGRTHGQHATPITFGYAIAGYVSRLGQSILAIEQAANNLRGKFCGPVGAYNATTLFIEDPREFEANVLHIMGLKAAEHSTQIVPPEALLNFFFQVITCGGILADLADDMRHLQRSEIAEVGEPFDASQVGSSAMPQKRNPITFENAKSMWKVFVGRLMTMMMNQLCEHQRDLTNSAAARADGETIDYLVSIAQRLTSIMGKLQVHKENLKWNLDLGQGAILAEPLQLVLAFHGHSNAHEKVRLLTLEAQRQGLPFSQIVAEDEDIGLFKRCITLEQEGAITNYENYVGIARERSLEIATHWKAELGL